MKDFDEKTWKIILASQRNEITEHRIYRMLSDSVKDEKNRGILRRISDDEMRHYLFWKNHSGKDVAADRLKIWLYYLLSRIFGITFGIKLMEKGEMSAQETYEKIGHVLPEVADIIKEEDEHEHLLIGMLDEERLKYVGSVVLGLNDALVELTGTLAGLSFAFQNTRLIAVAGLITGIAASLSMAASEYLSNKSDSEGKDPVKSALYTGAAYITTVLLLIAPYLFLDNFYHALGLTLLCVVFIIFIFTYYISVARDLDFKKRFFEMASISLGVAALSFVIGYAIRTFLGIDV